MVWLVTNVLFEFVIIFYYNNKNLFCSYNIVIPFDDFDISRNYSVFDVDIITQLQQNLFNTLETIIFILFTEWFFLVLILITHVDDKC